MPCSMAWLVIAKLSLSAQVKELCWAEGRLAVVTLTRYFLSSKEEKDVNEPLYIVLILPLLHFLNHLIRGSNNAARTS